MNTNSPGWALVIHGGAGIITRDTLTPDQDADIRAALSSALDAGTAILAAGGSALDAVEAAARALEDSPHFNAGHGAVLTADGRIELDAAIMDGRDRRAGAVAQLTATRSPVALARLVMEDGRHLLLAGPEADRFGRERGAEAATQGDFETPERRRQLDELLATGADAFDAQMKYGTIGAVARDRDGHLAAATSTGGVTGKRWGRIGDSPLIGAGTWADDRSCAVSATGSGEYFIRAAAGHEVGARMRLAGETLFPAAETVIGEIGALGGVGGLILVSADEAGWRMNSAGMYRAIATQAGERRTAIYGDEA